MTNTKIHKKEMEDLIKKVEASINEKLYLKGLITEEMYRIAKIQLLQT